MDGKAVHDNSFTLAFSGPAVNFNDGEVTRMPANMKLPTIEEVRAVIPKHCFEASAMRGFAYIFRDLSVIATFGFSAYLLLDPAMPSVWQDPLVFAKWFIGWNVYGFWQGTAFVGLWSIGHHCGHGAFSSSPVLSDIVGYVLHTGLLTPYFSWQFSHKKHHAYTNHLRDGEGNVPITATGFGIRPDSKHIGLAALSDALGHEQIGIITNVVTLLIGWPLYLLKNNDGFDHFRPSSKLFPERLRTKIAVSTAGILAVVGLLIWAYFAHGVWAVYNFYFLPYAWNNIWIIAYSKLNHVNVDVPHYGDDEWNWMRGTLATVDHSCGIFDWFHHKTGSTHVVHHISAKIPWYHLDEATIHVRNKLGRLHNYDSRPWYKFLYHTALQCDFVDSLVGVQYYKSFGDLIKRK
jgi:omega-6 fatty acid desaturase (delta-12 desaturase)